MRLYKVALWSEGVRILTYLSSHLSKSLRFFNPIIPSDNIKCRIKIDAMHAPEPANTALTPLPLRLGTVH